MTVQSWVAQLSVVVHATRCGTSASASASTLLPLPVLSYPMLTSPHQVYLLPGDMVLYESALLLHGRPYGLNGSSYANAFMHYRPQSW